MARPRADDAGVWRRAMHDVTPLRGHRPVPPEPLAVAPTPTREPARPAPSRQPLPALDRRAGVDRATVERLRRGRYPVEATLDLHGMTQDKAHRALSGFVTASRAAGRRCLLVVTGHGRTTGGVLQAAVPRGLDEPDLRHHLLAIAPAQPPHGGTGALYLLLRRLPH